MSEAKENKKWWVSKIESREDALKVVKGASTGFFVVAVLQAALSFLVGFSFLSDVVVYVVGGFILRRYNSRAAAVVLLVLVVLAVAGAGLNYKVGGTTNIFLTLIALWAAIRAVEATFKLRGRFSAEPATDKAPPT